jgi:hypothetical protein
MGKVFWGQRQTTYSEAKTEVLRECHNRRAIYPVVVAGRVAQHLRCGLLEAEKLLECMVEDGSLRYASKDEMRQAGVGFGYVIAADLSVAG